MIYLGIAVLILAALLVREIFKSKELLFRLAAAENEANKILSLENELAEKDKALQSVHIKHRSPRKNYSFFPQPKKR